LERSRFLRKLKRIRELKRMRHDKKKKAKKVTTLHGTVKEDGQHGSRKNGGTKESERRNSIREVCSKNHQKNHPTTAQNLEKEKRPRGGGGFESPKNCQKKSSRGGGHSY